MNKSKSIGSTASREAIADVRIPVRGNSLEYCKPTLICYGDVRDVTLGGSSAVFETGPFDADGCKISGQASRGCMP